MKKYFFILFFSLLSLVSMPTYALASTFHWGSDYSLPRGSESGGNLYAGAKTVVVSGTTRGDLYAAGTNVLVSGPVDADVGIFGGTVQLMSPVKGDIRIAGGTLSVTSTVAGDFILAGGNVHIVEGARAEGDAIVGGGSIRIEGDIQGRLTAVGTRVFLNGVVGGDARITADEVVLGPRARVEGNFAYKSVRPAVLQEGSQIRGTTEFIKVEAKNPDQQYFAFLWSTFFLVRLIAVLVATLVFYAVMREALPRMTQLAVREWWKNLGAGFFFVAGMPVAIMLLILTAIGLPLALAGGALYILFGITGIAFAPIVFVIGSAALFKKNVSLNARSVIVGVLGFSLLSVIPFVGSLLQIGLCLIALGVLTRLLFVKILIPHEVS